MSCSGGTDTASFFKGIMSVLCILLLFSTFGKRLKKKKKKKDLPTIYYSNKMNGKLGVRTTHDCCLDRIKVYKEAKSR